MKFTRAMLAFFAVPLLWAGLAYVFGHRLAQGPDFTLLVAMSFVFAMVWLGFVNMSVYALRKGRPPTATLYVATAVIGSGIPALVADLIHLRDVFAAIELSVSVMVLAAVSSLLFVVIAGLPWRTR